MTIPDLRWSPLYPREDDKPLIHVENVEVRDDGQITWVLSSEAGKPVLLEQL